MSLHDPDGHGKVARSEERSLLVEGGDRETDMFLERCVPGSTWKAKIRTAEVTATAVLSRNSPASISFSSIFT